MQKTIFETMITFAPKVNADDAELSDISLGRALIADTWRKQVEALRAETDTAKRKALKDSLPCITPGGTFYHISAAGLNEASGFLCADIDCKPEKDINAALKEFDLKAAISRLPYVAYCGKSCGGKGYFLIIPIRDASKYKEYYKALENDFRKGGLTLDAACSNIAFKRFVSWDDNPYINTAATPYEMPPKEERATRQTQGREYDDKETAAKVEAIIKECEDREIDITQSYKDWTNILAAFANTFGNTEQGFDYAQRISSQYPGYSDTQTEAKYKSFLSGKRKEGEQIKIGTFFDIARREMGKRDFDGIDTNSIAL